MGAARVPAAAGRRRARRGRRAHRRRGPGGGAHRGLPAGAPGRSGPDHRHARLRQLPQPPGVHHLPRHPRRRASSATGSSASSTSRPRSRRDEYLLSARLGAMEAVSSGITTMADTSYSGEPLVAAAEAGLRGRLYLEVFGVDDTRWTRPWQTCSGASPRRRPRPRRGSTWALRRTRPTPCRAASTRAVAAFARAQRPQPAQPRGREQGRDHLRAQRLRQVRARLSREDGLGAHAGPALRREPHQVPAAVGRVRPEFPGRALRAASRDDIRILKANDVAVAHCPKSNAKLGCGIAPLADLLHEGVRVGIGTDSPASSNIMDMFDEMRTMLFLHRAVERDVQRADAAQCVRIATLGGAEALGLEQQRRAASSRASCADLIAVDVAGSHFAPIDDPYSALVYGANQDDVVLTVVAGEELYRDRAYTGLDAAAIRADASAVRAEAARTRAFRRGARGRRRIRLVASPAQHDQRRGLLVLLDRRRVKFWQKMVFGIMARAHGRRSWSSIPISERQRLRRHQHVRRHHGTSDRTSRRLPTAASSSPQDVQRLERPGRRPTQQRAASSSQTARSPPRRRAQLTKATAPTTRPPLCWPSSRAPRPRPSGSTPADQPGPRSTTSWASTRRDHRLRRAHRPAAQERRPTS